MFKDKKIGFAGTVNAMPMHYAHKFKKSNYDVIYIVEIPKTQVLHRPENHFPEIAYPYPEWIKEIKVIKNYFTRPFPKIFFRKVINELNKCDIVFLNEYGISLIPYLNNDILKVVISSGSDIDVECDLNKIDLLAKKWSNIISAPVAKYFSKRRILINRKGIREANIISYFPKGFNQEADNLIESLKKGQKYSYVPRYDVSFQDIGLPILGAKETSKLVVFSGVRFLFHNLSEDHQFENKGNDIIIKGLSLYKKRNNNIEIHFVEKGKDINIAKEMCKNLEIEDNVIWHKQMTMTELITLYRKSDVCFDQVGNHWIGAIGFYALYIGKPLIANARLDIFGKIWKDDMPILDANTPEEVYEHLVKCESYRFRKRIGKVSHAFAIKYFDTNNVFENLKDNISKYISNK